MAGVEGLPASSHEAQKAVSETGKQRWQGRHTGPAAALGGAPVAQGSYCQV